MIEQEPQPPIMVYPATPGALLDNTFELSVEGQAIALERHRVFRQDNAAGFGLQSSRARFGVQGPFSFNLRTAAAGTADAEARWVGNRQPLQVNGRDVSGTLPGPGTYVVKIRGTADHTVFLWADNLATERPDPAAAHVLVVTDHGVTGSAELDQTQPIQSLLDRCSQSPSPTTLFFPAGVYRAGTLRIGSNTTVYLAPGALLKAVDDPEAFPGGNRRLLFVENAENVRLSGYGTIDGNGLRLRNELGLRVQDVDVTSSRNVVIENLLFRNAGSWCLHLLDSDSVRLSDVKVLSDHDAVDPDACRDVLIERLFAQCGDDAVAVKATGNSDLLRSCERIAVRDCLLSTLKTALKCGTENRAPIRDVTFENCDIFDASRGIAVWASDGFDYERIAYRNVRMQLIAVPGEDKSGEVLRFIIRERRGLGKLRDCLVEHVRANVINPSLLAGHPGAKLDGLVIRDVTLDVEPPRPGLSGWGLFHVVDADGVRIEKLSVRWNGYRDRWSGIAPGEPAGLFFEGLEESD